jgi:hypothetical protein
MTALAGSKVAEPSARASLPGLAGGALYQLPAVPWTQAALVAVQLVGLVLIAGGFLIGIGVLWVHLARALPLVGLLHHARALRAATLTAAGIALLALGRSR